MKKYFLTAVAACVALAACTKNEIKPVEVDQEITYQTIDTKAASSFSTSNKFYSWAYLLASDKTWDTDYASASKYIENSLIEYSTNAWKNTSTTYYWPKKAGLTFFSWSDNTADPKVTDPATVSCNQDTGIVIDNYSAFTDKNKDLLVAKVAANQTQNTTSHEGWSSGVPTVFYHILSALELTANTNMSTSDYTFKVKSVVFSGVLSKGKYVQGYSSTQTPIESSNWSGVVDANNYDVYAPSGELKTLGADAVTLTAENGEYTIFMPQTLPDDAKVTIVYQVTYGTTGITDEVSVDANLKSIFSEGWKPGYKYTLNITIGLEEILWDPDIQAWENKSGNVSI
ncbi:MAG: hypothetical protein ACI3ZK_02055 [Candidatus Cryptobacteroides sp.]